MESLEKIPRLGRDNYGRWKATVLNILEAKGVKGQIASTVRRPTEESKVAVWDKEDALARLLISTSMDDDHESAIRGCATAKDMWATITKLKEGTSVVNLYSAWQDFIDVQWEVETPASVFIGRINEAVSRLSSLGKKPDENMIVGRALSAVPNRLKTFRSTWNVMKRDASSVTWEDLQSALLAAETEMGPFQEDSGGALKSFKGRNGSGKQRRKKPFRCFNCNQEGHKVADCPRPRKGDGKQMKKGSGSGFVVSGDALDEEEWLADSGAYRHLTNHREWFVEIEDCNETVEIGDGKLLYAKEKGKIKIDAFDGSRWWSTYLNDVRYVPGLGSSNLFSLGAATSPEFEVQLKHDKLFLKRNGKVALVGKKRNNVYQLKIRTHRNPAMAAVARASMNVWHQRLGHVGKEKLRLIVRNNLATGIEIDEKSRLSFC